GEPIDDEQIRLTPEKKSSNNEELRKEEMPEQQGFIIDQIEIQQNKEEDEDLGTNMNNTTNEGDLSP
ncbi:hypothetical protein HAX54_004857, partial [Datura stramonium]|nr:hypothetical protein [Datura stramonium]